MRSHLYDDPANNSPRTDLLPLGARDAFRRLQDPPLDICFFHSIQQFPDQFTLVFITFLHLL